MHKKYWNPKYNASVERDVSIAFEAVLPVFSDAEHAYAFLLEELDAASQGNNFSKEFAAASGINPAEYRNALSNNDPLIDGAGGPQQTLTIYTLPKQLAQKAFYKDAQTKHPLFNRIPNPDTCLPLRAYVVDRIMQHYGFGKYATKLS